MKKVPLCDVLAVLGALFVIGVSVCLGFLGAPID